MSNETREAAEHLFGNLVTMQRSLRSLTRTWAHDEAPLSRTELALLTTLAETGESRLGAVAGCLGVSPSVASRQVAALHAAGLVDRRPDPEDGRAELLALSESGLSRLREIRDLGVHRLVALLEDWPPARLHHAGDLLGELAAALAPPPDGHAPSPHSHLQEAASAR